MASVTVELEPEIEEWVLSLEDDRFGQVARYINLLADRGVHLGEPFTRQLHGKLRDLRFYLGRQQTRVTYTSPRAGEWSFSRYSVRRDNGNEPRSSERRRRCSSASAKETQLRRTNDS